MTCFEVLCDDFKKSNPNKRRHCFASSPMISIPIHRSEELHSNPHCICAEFVELSTGNSSILHSDDEIPPDCTRTKLLTVMREKTKGHTSIKVRK